MTEEDKICIFWSLCASSLTIVLTLIVMATLASQLDIWNKLKPQNVGEHL